MNPNVISILDRCIRLTNSLQSSMAQDSAEMEEIPLTRLEGDTLIIREGVRAIGDFEVEMVEDEHGEMIGTHAMPVVPGTVRVDGLFFGETVPRAVRSVRGVQERQAL